MSQLDLVRKKFPEYRDISDEELGTAIHQKHYSDIPIQDFWKQVNTEEFQPEEYVSPEQATMDALSRAIPKTGELLKAGAKGLAATPFSPGESIENAGYGIAQGGREIIENAPGNMLEYSREHRNQQGNRIEEMRAANPNAKIINADPIQLLTDTMIDYLKDKLTVSPENKELNRQFVEKMRPSNEEGAAQEMWQGLGKFFPKAVATGGNPVLASILEGASTNTNAFENIVPVIAGQKAHQYVAPKVKGAIKKGIEKTGEGVGTVFNKAVTKPIETFKQKNKLETEKMANEQSKLVAEQEHKAAQEAIEKGHAEFTGERSGDVIENTAKTLAEAGKQLTERGKQDYTEFNKSKWGQKRVFEPIQPEFFQEQYNLPKGAVSELLQKKIDNVIGTYESTTKIDPLTGQPQFRVNKNSKPATVAEYIDLSRDVYSEIKNLYDRADAESITKTKADKLRGYAKSLEKLEADIQGKIKGTLPEKQNLAHETNQQFWKDYVVPWDYSHTLKGTKGNHPGISTPNIIEKLGKEGYNRLSKILLENEEAAQAIGKHDWRSVDINNPKALGDALEGDLGRTLPKEYKESLKKNFDTLMDKKKTIDALKTKLAEEGLTQKQIDAKINKYKLLVGAIGLSNLLGMPGVYFALKILK